MAKIWVPLKNRIFLIWNGIDHQARLLVLGVVIGMITGLVGVGFRQLIELCANFFFSHQPERLFLIGRWWRYLVFLVPALGGLITGVALHLWLKEDEAGGVPEVMMAVSLKGGIVKIKNGLKGLLAAITIGSGGSAGPEGPIVEISASLGSWLGQKLQLSHSELRLLVGCGAAAGISAVFAAPLGGLFFALEIILGEFSLSSFAPIVLASVSSSVVAKTILGDQPAFQVKSAGLGSVYDIIFYMLLGVLAGLVAVGFKEMLSRTKTWFDNKQISALYKPALGGLAVGLFGLVLPQILGEGYNVVTSAMNGNIIWWLLLLLLAGKMVSTSITLGSGAPGGAFAPSLYIGSMLGAAFGQIVSFILPGQAALASTFALTGAAGVVAGALNAPITAGLIIFEVSGSYKVILPAMIVVSVAAVVSNRFKKGSIYTSGMIKDGLPVDRFRNYSHLSNILCRQVMKREIIVAGPQTRLVDIYKILSRSDQQIVPVSDSDNHLLGVISWQTIKLLLTDENLKCMLLAYDMMSTPHPVSADDNLLKVMIQLGNSDNEQVTVVENGRLVGLIGWREISSHNEMYL